MELTKSQRRTCVFDYRSVSKKKKFMEKSENSSRKCLTHFEDLSNELFYEIFSFLDVYDVYQAFYSLNIRLQSFLTNSTLPLKINISSMSKSTFQRYYRHIIMPCQHRIISLRIADPLVVDLVFSPVRIVSNFIRLETLIFDNIKSEYLSNIISHLSTLTNLSSLIIIPIDVCQNANDLYHHIFRLSTLKYSKVSLRDQHGHYPLPVATNVTSPIEHLIIDSNFNLNNLNTLSTYVPQLRRLKLSCVHGTGGKLPLLNNLTHVSLNLKSVTFDQLELMIRSLNKHLQILQISTKEDREYLNAKRWEELILSAIPNLRIFDFQYKNFLQNNDENNQDIFDSMINQFSSLFWSERKWFFAYQLITLNYRNQVVFYSLNPHRKQYTLYKQLVNNIHPCHERKTVNFVNHINIQSEGALKNCIHHFPHTTKLTLSHNFCETRMWHGILLKRIIPLQQLTILIIDCDNFRFKQLIKLLHWTPNIHTLTYNCHSVYEKDATFIQQDKTFRLVSNTNKITNVTIKEPYSTENTKLLVALCPQMKHLVIDTISLLLETALRFILMKTKISLQHLCSLCTKNTTKSMFEILKTLIESEELIDDYSIKLIDSELYLWW